MYSEGFTSNSHHIQALLFSVSSFVSTNLSLASCTSLWTKMKQCLLTAHNIPQTHIIQLNWQTWKVQQATQYSVLNLLTRINTTDTLQVQSHVVRNTRPADVDATISRQNHQSTVHLLDLATRSSSSFFLIAYELEEPCSTHKKTIEYNVYGQQPSQQMIRTIHC